MLAVPKAGLDGVVSSAWEVEAIKEMAGDEFVCLTPGIRPEGTVAGDQTRVVTPSQAKDRLNFYRYRSTNHSVN